VLGYDKNSGVFYEGASNWGAPINERPTLYPMNLILSGDQPIVGFSGRDFFSKDLVFRELSYDPVSNIRRGFCYCGYDSPQQTWHIRNNDTERPRTLDGVATFQPRGIAYELRTASLSQPLVCLGNAESFTVGAIVNIETTITGREIITVKMRQLFGVFPTLKKDYPTPEDYKKINTQLQKVKDSYYGSLPESVIDRCRDAASEILGIFNDQPKQDLGKQVSALQRLDKENKKRVVESAADIIRIFHSRGKPSEQAMRDGLPAITEQDAELAVQCLGTIIRDLGYGKWSE